MEVEGFIKKYNIDTTTRPPFDLEYVCPVCASFYSTTTAPAYEMIHRGKRLGFTRYLCDCHGETKPMNLAVEVHTNTPAMEWEKEQLQQLQRRLESELEDLEKHITNYYD